MAARCRARAVDVARRCTTATSCSSASVRPRGRATSCSCGWASRPAQLSVKRAVRPDGDGWWVRGDNPFGTTDSEVLGPAQVVAVVRARLWPRPGPVPPRR